MARSTRIYTVFLSAGHPVGFEAYQRHHPHVKIPENAEILDSIRSEARDVDFEGTSDPISLESAVSAIDAQKADLHGLLVFGAPPEQLLSVGLPVVAVERPLEGCPTMPFHAYKDSRVVTSYLPAHRDRDPTVYARRISHIAKQVKLIDAIARMRSVRILVVTDLPPLGYFEPVELQIDRGRAEYDRVFTDNLRETFGTQLVTIPQKTLFDRVKAADEKSARSLAETWIEEAMGLRGTNKDEVIRSAKLYLGMKELLEEHNCNAITTEGFGWPPLTYETSVKEGIPSQGLPTTQFLTDDVAAASETLIDCLITQQLALYITGSGGLLGDYSIDPFISTAIVAHCEGTLRPYGDERRSPYFIRNIPFVSENAGGACAEARYPIDEIVTVAKISMYRRKLALFSGRTVSGEELFPYWDDILGRNKVAIRADAQNLLKNVEWETFGHHRTVFFGDYRQEFIDLAKLIGYEVVEEDK